MKDRPQGKRFKLMSPFFLLCAAGLSAIFSSTIAKSPVLPLFASYLGADPKAVGGVAAVSSFTGVVFSIPVGLLSDKFGRRKLLLWPALVFATAPFFYPFVTKLWQLALVRFYHGLATAAFVPVAMACVADLFHEERGEKMGWFSTATLLGRFAAPLAGGALIGLLILNPLLSYRAVYILSGSAGICALFFILSVREPEKSSERHQSWAEAWHALRAVLSNPAILVTSGAEAAILFAYGTFETFFPLYAMERGLSAYAIGLCLSAQVISLALTKPMMGRFSDRHGRTPQIFVGALLGAASIGGFAVFATIVPFLTLSVLFGICMSTLTSATSAFVADLSRTARGSAMGILGSIMDIGHTTGPLIAGAVAGYVGYAFSFVTASAVLVGVALAFAGTVFRKSKPA